MCENTTVGHGEQEQCRHNHNVMHLKICMEFHSYFAVFAQMTGKKHKAQSHVPHTLCSSEHTDHIRFMSSLYVRM